MKSVRVDSLGVGDVFRAPSMGSDGTMGSWPATVLSVKKASGKLKLAVEYGGGGEGKEVLAPDAKVPLVHRAGEPAPPRRTRAQYVSEVKRRLAAYEPQLAKEIRAKLKKRPPKGASQFDVEVAWSHLARAFPVAGFFMDAENGQLDYLPFSRKKLFRWNELTPFHEDGVSTEEAHTKLLLETFLRAWKKAGGLRYPLAGVAQLHDETWGVDLRTLERKRL